VNVIGGRAEDYNITGKTDKAELLRPNASAQYNFSNSINFNLNIIKDNATKYISIESNTIKTRTLIILVIQTTTYYFYYDEVSAFDYALL
jgi:hypothetical protein